MKMLTWLPRWIWLIIWFIGQIISSSVAVLNDLLTPGIRAEPGIARVRTDCRTDAEITMLSAFITITPGTLTLGTHIDEKGVRWIYVHSLYDGNPSAVAEAPSICKTIFWRPCAVGDSTLRESINETVTCETRA